MNVHRKIVFLFFSFSCLAFGGGLKITHGSYLPSDSSLPNIKFMVSATLPEVDSPLVREALRFILAHETNEFLSSPDDRTIFALAKKYSSGEKPFVLRDRVIKENAAESRMLFNTSGYYGVKKGMRASLELLALTLYHELLHEIEWKELAAQGMTEDSFRVAYTRAPWKYEIREYAAELRFFYALAKTGKIPLLLSRDDLTLCLKDSELWPVFQAGKFKEWYKKQQKDGWVVPGDNIKKIEK